MHATHHAPIQALLFPTQAVGKMLKSIGDRAFSVAAPTLWNAFPASLRNTTSLFTFKSCLKTYLFKLAFNV